MVKNLAKGYCFFLMEINLKASSLMKRSLEKENLAQLMETAWKDFGEIMFYYINLMNEKENLC